MSIRLFFQAIFKFAAGAATVGLLLFGSAGTLRYPNGWLFMGLLFLPMFLAGLVLMVKNPQLLQKRLNAKEQENEQKTVLLLSGLMFIAGFLACGLSFRFSWMLPWWISMAASVLFLCAYLLYAEVLRENIWLSRTIEVQEGQTVVDTGLYGIVRHPMYAVTVLLFLCMPLVLGSLPGFVIFLIYPMILVRRIRNEEQVLEENLSGYREYEQKVKYRMIPFIW